MVCNWVFFLVVQLSANIEFSNFPPCSQFNVPKYISICSICWRYTMRWSLKGFFFLFWIKLCIDRFFNYRGCNINAWYCKERTNRLNDELSLPKFIFQSLFGKLFRKKEKEKSHWIWWLVMNFITKSIWIIGQSRIWYYFSEGWCLIQFCRVNWRN